ncbi:MAG: extracellular solute-binding protein [Treponema sp.]|nr:extracellular solute-binding protein [Treponema sp.]MCL2237149.1 extracellular solute-binding protein [Treponema sp.]
MRKLAFAAVILLMIASLVFTACGGSGKIPDMVTKSALEPFPQTAELKVQIFNRGTDGGRSQATDNAWTDWIKTKVKADLNINVTFVPVGRWSEGQDMVNLMVSKDAPDLCYTYSGGMVSQFRDWGGIFDVAPFIDSFLPDLKKLLGDDPAFPGNDFIYRNKDSKTGAIYSIPSYRVALAMRNVFIRKDWLDALGMAVPTTTDEFFQALVAFRDRDPGNVGRNRVVPFGQNNDARWGFANLIHPSIDPNLSNRDRWIYNVADRNIAMPGYKEGARMLNRWYNEGLIYRDFPIMETTEDFYNLIKSGAVGAFAQNWDLPYRQDYKILEDLRRNVPNANYVPVDCILDANGVASKDMYDKVGLQIFIPSFSQNYEAALKYLNWLAIPENFQYLQVGEEGRNHIIVNGVPNTVARPAGDPWIMNSGNNIDYTMPMNGVEMGSTELNARVLALTYGNIPAEVIVEAYSTAIRNARAASVYQAVTRVNQYEQTLKAKADALLAQAVTASPADFDRVWDAGYADWLSSGGQAVIDERSSLWPAR